MARREKAKPADKMDAQVVKLNLQLPADLAKRFGVHAEMAGLSKSDLFAQLVRDGCRRWVVHDRTRPAAAEPASEADAA